MVIMQVTSYKNDERIKEDKSIERERR